MREITVRELTRHVEPLSSDDTLGRAVELIRRAPGGTVPVVGNGTVVGVVTEGDVLRGLPLEARRPGEDAVEETRVAPVLSLMIRDPLLVPDWYSARQAARLMASRSLAAVPVVDDEGGYVGIVCRSDLVESLSRTFRPLSIGGMATPLGVYLTTGSHRAGAGDLGLFLTGVTMFVLMGVGHWLVFGGLWCVDEIVGSQLSEVYLSPFLEGARGLSGIGWTFDLVTAVVFFFLIRSVPLSGYHAAEHQVVHTIERGRRLDRDIVRQMPRPHPRCGTNLAAFMMLYFLLLERLGQAFARQGSLHGPIVALAITLPLWRFLGMQLQQFFTTRPATDKQLDSGMQAGAGILSQYHREPTYRANRWRRLWNAGLLQVIAGAATAWGVARLLSQAIDLRVFLG